MSKRWVDYDERLDEYRLCERINERHTLILARSPTKALMELLLAVMDDFGNVIHYKIFISEHFC